MNWRVTGDWIDISPLLSTALATWPGDAPYAFSHTLQLEHGDSVNLGSISTSLHAGAHVDAPYHFDPAGTTVDKVEIETYIGLAQVVDVSGLDVITTSAFANVDLLKAPRLLLKTDAWADKSVFPTRIPAIGSGVPELLGNSGIRLLGLDLPSVDAIDSIELPTHHALLRAGTAILEGLDLQVVKPGIYFMAALPLKIFLGDGSPVRAVIRKMESM